METRAHHVLIGTFVIVTLLAGLGFVMWLSMGGFGRDTARYAIRFEGAVTGLSVASDVRYNGIKVGEVTELRLDPKDPSKVLALIEVAKETPIHTDSVASLDYLGVTGVAYVQITGGSPDAPLLRLAADEAVPMIPSRPSGVQELVAGVPDLLMRATQLVENLNALVQPENREAIAVILQNAEVMTGALVDRQPELDAVVANVQQMSADLAVAAQHLRDISDQLLPMAARVETSMTKLDRAVDDVPPLLEEVGRTAAAYGELGRELESLIEANRGAVTAFSQEGLDQFTALLRQSRDLVSSLDRLTERIESNPQRFLFGRSAPEYRPE
jgi:phospholipid/cholesterol/gamma-HCH transport system substrate-binding protein